MDIRHLRYFVTIADCASISNASERLHIAQSSLSVHLANLETEVGARLMERGRAGVQLTPAGQIFYEQAQQLLKQYHALRQSVRGAQLKPRGRVALGMPSTTSAIVAGELYARIADELSDVEIYVTDAGAGSVYEWLLDGRIDIAVMFNVPDDAELDVTPLYEEEFWLVSPGEHRFADPVVDFQSIFDVPLVTSSRATPWRKALDEIAERFGKPINPILETESIAALRSVLAAGHACAVLPRSYIEREISGSDLVCRPLVNPALRGMVSLVHLSASPLEPAQSAVKDIMITIMQRPGSAPDEAPDRAITIARKAPTIMQPTRSHRRRPR